MNELPPTGHMHTDPKVCHPASFASILVESVKMKVSQIVIALALGVVSNVNAAYQGTKEDFMKAISEGKIPEGTILDPEVEDELSEYQSLRRLQEPRGAGERCGRNTACADGLDCQRVGVVRLCMPVTCMESAVSDFIDENSLHDYPQTIMEGTGMLLIETGRSTDRGVSFSSHLVAKCNHRFHGQERH